MSRNLALNNISNVNVKWAVIAKTSGKKRFFNSSVARDGVGEMIEAISIDDLAVQHGKPDVVFLDIEGFECEALQGAKETLKLDCDWFIEIHIGCGLEMYGGTVERILDCFPSSRFKRLYWVMDTEEDARLLVNDCDAPSTRFGLVAIRETTT